MNDARKPVRGAWRWLGELIVALVALYAVWWVLVKPAPFDLPAQGTELPAATSG